MPGRTISTRPNEQGGVVIAMLVAHSSPLIDLGQTSVHLVGQDERDAIVLRIKLSRAQLTRRLADTLPCLIAWKPVPALEDFRVRRPGSRAQGPITRTVLCAVGPGSLDVRFRGTACRKLSRQKVEQSPNRRPSRRSGQ